MVFALYPFATVLITHNATIYKNLLHNSMFPTLWQQFGEEPQMGVMVSIGPHTLGHMVYRYVTPNE